MFSPKHIVLILASLMLCLVVLRVPLPASSGQGTNAAPLTNSDIIMMAQAKLPDSVIIAKIRSSSCKFDTSADALIELRQTGVSGAVLAAMAECGSPLATAPAAASNPNNPMAPHPPGIYWEQTGAAGPHMVAIETSPYSRGKTSGLFGATMSMGLSKMKWKVVIDGARARVRIPNSTPEFWFYFANAGSAFSSGPSSPGDFTLVALERHSSDRELVVGKVGAFGASNGIPSKDTIPVQSKEVAPGIYKVDPARPLKAGEYAFLPAGENMELSAAGGKLFDFEVDSGR